MKLGKVGQKLCCFNSCMHTSSVKVSRNLHSEEGHVECDSCCCYEGNELMSEDCVEDRHYNIEELCAANCTSFFFDSTLLTMRKIKQGNRGIRAKCKNVTCIEYPKSKPTVSVFCRRATQSGKNR